MSLYGDGWHLQVVQFNHYACPSSLPHADRTITDHCFRPTSARGCGGAGPASDGWCWRITPTRECSGAGTIVRITRLQSGWEVSSVKQNVSSEAVKRFAKRSTKASAALERRAVPAGYVRSVRVEKLLAQRQSKS